MTSGRLILESLRHHWRIHASVVMGVAVATAVLTGALVVGDSVRGSLRDLTIQRLGHIDHVLSTGLPFRAELAAELEADPGFDEHFNVARPGLLMRGTVQAGNGPDRRLATGVQLLGVTEDFWALDAVGLSSPSSSESAGGASSEGANASPADGVRITQTLAGELGVEEGDELLIRVALLTAIPSDSPLGEKEDTTASRRLPVAGVLPDKGLARFSLTPSQHAPRNVFLPLGELQDLLEQEDKANLIFVAAAGESLASSREATGEEATEFLRSALQPTLADYGLTLERIRLGASTDAAADNIPEDPAQDESDLIAEFYQLASEQLVLPDEVVQAARRAFDRADLQPAVSYLANTITTGDARIPYSTITGIDSTAALGPLLDQAGQPINIADDQIVLNRWAADDLGAQVGDTIEITYYEPESTHGVLTEAGPVAFRLAAIAELQTRAGRRTRAADPQLTPPMEGVTDQESIENWDLPFELTEEIRPVDEDYWDRYSTTPKAFVSLATAERLWGNRWGTYSMLRLPAGAAESAEQAAARLEAELAPAALGFTWLPVKRDGLAAASGTTPFDGLFLAFSFFLIASAVMLIALLFQLGIAQRASEAGLLAAAGFTRRQVRRLLSAEALVVAVIGAVAGVAIGVAYARLMILGLTTVLVEAIATPFIQMHVTPRSLVLGACLGVVACWLTVWWSLRKLSQLPARQLLAGDTESHTAPQPGDKSQQQVRGSGRPWVAFALSIFAGALAAIGTQAGGEAQAGAFFGSGAALLAAMLWEIRRRLRSSGRTSAERHHFSLWGLATRNASRHPGRSTLTIGLVAAASFLIVAVSAFHLDTSDAGTGGYRLMATSDVPILYDLDTEEGRRQLRFRRDDNELLSQWRIDALRAYAGEDASCLNLYRPQQPRVLGVPASMARAARFDWADVADLPPADEAAAAETSAADSPTQRTEWDALQLQLGDDAAGETIVPVVLDMNTAMYSLQIYGGVGSQLEIRDGFGQPVTLQIVGLLKNSVLQGELLVSEANFTRLYPEVSGHRYFLMRPAGDGAAAEAGPANASGESGSEQPPSADEVTAILESTLSDDGFDVVDARERLAELLAVQNTYLSTFQSLGALGLLLGTIGLAVVQLRSVLERRGELALMRASGFRTGRLVQMVLRENALLLVGGLAVGCVAAALALAPYWTVRDAEIPWGPLAALLAVIGIVGLVAGWLATRANLRAPVLPALRGD